MSALCDRIAVGFDKSPADSHKFDLFLQTKKLSVSEKLIQYILLKTISDFLGGDHVFLHGKNQLSGGKFVMPVAIAEFIIFSVQ